MGGGAGTGPRDTRLSDFLQRQGHDVGDDDPLLDAGPAVHAHQDDIVEQQQVTKVRYLKDRKAGSGAGETALRTLGTLVSG